MLFWNIAKGNSPQYLRKYIPPLQTSRNPLRLNLNHFSSIPVKTDYFANSFFPYTVNQWNRLDPSIRNSSNISIFKNALLKFIRPIPSNVFNVNDAVGLKFLTRLRLNLSHLREHKFRHNFKDTINPICSCALLTTESTMHYLLHCPFYSNQRKTLLDRLKALDLSTSELSEDNLIKLLLYGNPKSYCLETNTNILTFTIDFLKTSERFDVALL